MDERATAPAETLDLDPQDVPTDLVGLDGLARALAEAEAPATLRFFGTDPAQLLRWAGPGAIRIEGRSARELSAPNWVDLEVDGRRLRRVLVRGGWTALATAERLGAVLPDGYVARFEPSAHPEVDVTLRVFRV